MAWRVVSAGGSDGVAAGRRSTPGAGLRPLRPRLQSWARARPARSRVVHGERVRRHGTDDRIDVEAIARALPGHAADSDRGRRNGAQVVVRTGLMENSDP